MNKKLFASGQDATDAVNEAGGKAYSFSDEHALAQYAVTGCINDTYYATADTQLERVMELAKKVSPEFLAQTSIYARQEGNMKDMPALLLAILSTRDIKLTRQAFSRVCDDAKMVKNFVQIIRSGQVGRKSLGTALKRKVQDWFDSRTDDQLISAMVGGDVSMADLIRLSHPSPATERRSDLYKYIIGKSYRAHMLPESLYAFENLKAKIGSAIPHIPFQMLTNLDLTVGQWRDVARSMSWSQLRQNLNMLAKRGAFEDKDFTAHIASFLSSAAQVSRAKAMPFQMLAAYKASIGNVPAEISNALQDAMEHSLGNVPSINGQVYVCVDVSGSMAAPVTGNRGSATSSVTCRDVAALFGSALLRKNPNNVRVLPFAEDLRAIELNGRDSVMTNTQKINALPGGGTNCSAPLARLNAANWTASAVLYISDNESWIDSSASYYKASGMMAEWRKFKGRCPKAKLVCIDIQPNATMQAPDGQDRLNVGGFTDSVFGIVDLFLKDKLEPSHWVGEIKKVEL